MRIDGIGEFDPGLLSGTALATLQAELAREANERSRSLGLYAAAGAVTGVEAESCPASNESETWAELSTAQSAEARDAVSSLAEKYRLTAEDFTLVSVPALHGYAVVCTTPNGVDTHGSGWTDEEINENGGTETVGANWNDLMHGDKDGYDYDHIYIKHDDERFRVNIYGRTIDTRRAMTYEVYLAMLASPVCVNRLKNSIAMNDLPTWLSGEAFGSNADGSDNDFAEAKTAPFATTMGQFWYTADKETYLGVQFRPAYVLTAPAHRV